MFIIVNVYQQIENHILQPIDLRADRADYRR